jgi:MOSC domain-containing protein YiiM
MATLISIQAGRPRKLGSASGVEPWEKPWRSAFFKSPLSGPVHVGRTNVAGDHQADLRVHGGPDMAVLCYSADHYPTWREELGIPEMGPGGFGENFTIEGLDEWSVCIGDVYSVGDVIVQVSQPRGPCYKIGYRWRRADLLERVEHSGRHGWYMRVLQEGTVEAGMHVELLERPNADWTVRRAADTHRSKAHDSAAAELALVAEYAERPRRQLERAIARAQSAKPQSG